MNVDYFQLRKNSQQVIRIFRGPFEGHDITRLQIWYRDRDGNDYKPGRVVAFQSEAIPGVIEGLLKMAAREPAVHVPAPSQTEELLQILHRILKGHRKPLHWEILAEIVSKERPQVQASKWAVYNCLLENSDIFDQVEEDVFSAGP